MDQKSNKAIIWILGAIVAALLIGGIAYAVISSNEKTPPTTSTPPNATTKEETTKSNDDASTEHPMITFTDEGFSPSSYSVKKGSSVMVMNNSKMDLEFSSNDHPAHTDETELNMNTLKPGASGTFTVTKAGTWGFHDHLHDEFTGTLVVTQ